MAATEYKLNFTAQEINEKLEKVEEINNLADKNHEHEWEEINNKPFIETVGDLNSIVWDGNTTGLESYILSGIKCYKVSNSTPSYGEMYGRLTINRNIDSVISPITQTSSNPIQYDGFCAISAGPEGYQGFVAYNDNNLGISSGTYFAWRSETSFTSSIVVANFEDIKKELDVEYLPHHEHRWWNVKNKPFESVLKWDGNTEGLEGVGASSAYYKISDATPVIDLSTGASVKYVVNGNEYNATINGTSETTVVKSLPSHIALSISMTQYIQIYYEGNSAGYSPGIYFYKSGTSYTSELFLPDVPEDYVEYGFSEQKLKEEALPEHTQDWKTIENSPFKSVLAWDGNTEGLEIGGPGGSYYKVSDATPIFDMNSGLELKYNSGSSSGSYIFDGSSPCNITSYLPDYIYIAGGMTTWVYIYYEGNSQGYSPGIYFYKSSVYRTKEISLPNSIECDGFSTNILKEESLHPSIYTSISRIPDKKYSSTYTLTAGNTTSPGGLYLYLDGTNIEPIFSAVGKYTDSNGRTNIIPVNWHYMITYNGPTSIGGNLMVSIPEALEYDLTVTYWCNYPMRGGM